MDWFLGALILAAVGYGLRRLLRMGTGHARSGLAPLPELLQAVYHPVAQEVETHSAILGISLNDAFEERDAQRMEQAWRMMRLSSYEWERLAELLAALLKVLTRQLARAAVVAAPPQGMVPRWFKTRAMIDYVRMFEFFNALSFNSKRRFHLQLRLLRRATVTLTDNFHRAFRTAERIQDPSPELWTQFDYFFHDFDLVAKETLLAFRALLVCLGPSALSEISADLEDALRRVVRSSAVFTGE